MLEPFIALGWIAIWAAFDVLVVEHYLVPLDIWSHPNYKRFPPSWPTAYSIDMYLLATWFILFPITTVIAFGLFTKTTALIGLMFLGGWEDVLYYWLQGKRVPEKIEWLPLTPSDKALYMRSVIGLGLIVLIAVL